MCLKFEYVIDIDHDSQTYVILLTENEQNFIEKKIANKLVKVVDDTSSNIHIHSIREIFLFDVRVWDWKQETESEITLCTNTMIKLNIRPRTNLSM